MQDRSFPPRCLLAKRRGCSRLYPGSMTIKLNHTIVHSVDKRAAAEFFAGIFGLPAPKPFYHFLDVELGNEVTLAFLDADGMEIQVQHYAFLVSEKEFDQIFGRIKERSLDYWADPGRKEKGRINRHFGGRGVYFLDPSGHLLEIITKPYGSGGGSRGLQMPTRHPGGEKGRTVRKIVTPTTAVGALLFFGFMAGGRVRPA